MLIRLHRLQGKAVENSEVERCVVKLTAVTDILDGILGKQKFMGGDEYSLVDIMYMPTLHMLFKTDQAELLRSRKNLMRWWNEVTSREAWKTSVKVIDEASAPLEAALAAMNQ